MTALLIILICTIFLFIWGKFPPDLVAVMALLALFLSGILDLDQSLSGFSNPTVIMIAALFVVGEALSLTGWTAWAGQKLLAYAGPNPSRLLALLMLVAAILSAFVSNTGTVATLLPVSIASAWNVGSTPSKFLIPLAFGANTGGLLTLTGTPPNIIVNNALVQQGYTGFSFFEYAFIGLPLLLIAVLYMRLVGKQLLPQHQTQNRPVNFDETFGSWVKAYELENGYYSLRVRKHSPLVNQSLDSVKLNKNFGVNVLKIRRPSLFQFSQFDQVDGLNPFGIIDEFPHSGYILHPNDLLIIKGEPEAVHSLMVKYNLALQPLEVSLQGLKEGLFTHEIGLVEVLVSPRSPYIKQEVQLATLFDGYNLQLLATQRKQKVIREERLNIESGDTFLVRGTWEDIARLDEERNHFVVCGNTDQLAKGVERLDHQSWVALAALVLMVISMVLGWVPGVIAALIAAGIPLLSGILSLRQAYAAISWGSVILIAAMIPMSLAMQKTGLAQLAAETMANQLGSVHPIALMAGVFVLTTAFSQVINNSATAVLMTPIALESALQMGLAPQPLMMAVAVSASTAFLTPIGTTTNAMVMSAGGYSFSNYVKVGLPLLLLFLLCSMLMIPWIWPF